MGKRLVTIATFDQAAQARLAKNVLDDAGIQSTVNDESIVAMDWLLSNAVGGVKVQVWEEDAERAVVALEEKLGADGEGFHSPITPEELAAEAEAAIPEEGEETEAPALVGTIGPIEPEVTTNRDDYARRSAFAGILGLIIPPVAAFAVYLFLNGALGEGTLSPRGRLNLFVGGFMAVAGLIWFPFFLAIFF